MAHLQLLVEIPPTQLPVGFKEPPFLLYSYFRSSKLIQRFRYFLTWIEIRIRIFYVIKVISEGAVIKIDIKNVVKYNCNIIEIFTNQLQKN